MDTPKKLISTSPHIHDTVSTKSIMWTVVLCLMPAVIWGVFVFGLSALLVMLAAVLGSVVTEAVIMTGFKKNTLIDGSAVLTGVLIGMNMPPAAPLYVPFLTSVFSIALVKWAFGGLGNNWMNPALAGRVFALISWPKAMTTWSAPLTYSAPDAVSGATVLGAVKTSLSDGVTGTGGPMGILSSAHYPVSPFDTSVTDWLNTNIFDVFGAHLPSGYLDLFVGNVSGCIGEVSALLLLLGAVWLIAKKIVTWEIPVFYVLSFSLLIWIFDGTRFSQGLFQGDILFHLLSGGLILGAFFMASDMVTTPITFKGRIVFALGAGFFTFLIRVFGSFPEGVSLAIILMNVMTPVIDRFMKNKRFGVQKGKLS